MLVVLVLAYFFADGLRYSGTGETLAIWLPILAVPIGVLLGAWTLHKKGRNRLAMGLLVLLATPPALFALFFGLLLATSTRWN